MKTKGKSSSILSFLVISLLFIHQSAMSKESIIEYKLIRGTVDFKNDTADFLPFGVVFSKIRLKPPVHGDYNLELLSSTGELIRNVSFEPRRSVPDLPSEISYLGSFLLPIPIVPTFEKAKVLHGSKELCSISASSHIPNVQIITPNGGEKFTEGEINIEWIGQDADDKKQYYTVLYSKDGGSVWEAIAVDIIDTHYSISHKFVSGTDRGLIRVIISDGFNTAFDESDDFFSISNKPPDITIISPIPNSQFIAKQQVFFEAIVYDQEDGSITGKSIQWFSSIDGFIGDGILLNREAIEFSEGSHTITLKVTDSHKNTISVSQIKNVEIYR